MANICTTFVRIAWRLAERGGIVDATIAAAALGEHESYCMPFRLRHLDASAAPAGLVAFTDLEYGTRHSPGLGPEDLWSLVAPAADSLWVRWYDDGGDWDVIEGLDAVGRTPLRLCRYGFDAVRGRQGKTAIAGSYLAGNDRSTIRTSPLRSHVGRVTPAEAARLVGLEGAELLWNGRVVHCALAAMGGWDNCVDPDYRVAIGAPDWSA